MRYFVSFIVCLFLAFPRVFSQENNAFSSAAADALITRFMAQWDIKGGSVAITKNGKMLYNKGFGSASSNYAPARPNTLYRIASVSKPITSIAVMKLVEDGKLKLSDTVFGKNGILNRSYYNNVISDKRIYSITVQELLEHSAGWDRNLPTDGYDHSDAPFFPLHVTAVEDEPNPVGDSTLIRFSLRKGLNYSPGTRFSYSNVGYLVLGKVIEKVSGMKYEDYVTKYIFQPSGIQDIYLGKNLLQNKRDNESEYFGTDKTPSCYGNGQTVTWQYGGFNLEAMNAHGGWIASAPALAKLLLTVDGVADSPDCLSHRSIDLMTKPSIVNKNYAKGWSVNKNNIWHTGSLDGTASFICKTADGYTWAFLFNSRADNSDKFWNEFDKLPWECLKAFEGTL